jgi:transcriptional regulator with XRE-family HTH domain
MTEENVSLVNARSKTINRLVEERDYRTAYIRAKLDVLIPSQLRALRLRRELTQPVLAETAGMKQSRISAMETPGKVNFNLETLVRLAATFGVGLIVKFVPFSEMLRWENEYSQDVFDVVPLSKDDLFLKPISAPVQNDIATMKDQGVPAVAKEQLHQLATGGISNGTRATA